MQMSSKGGMSPRLSSSCVIPEHVSIEFNRLSLLIVVATGIARNPQENYACCDMRRATCDL